MTILFFFILLQDDGYYHQTFKMEFAGQDVVWEFNIPIKSSATAQAAYGNELFDLAIDQWEITVFPSEPSQDEMIGDHLAKTEAMVHAVYALGAGIDRLLTDFTSHDWTGTIDFRPDWKLYETASDNFITACKLVDMTAYAVGYLDHIKEICPDFADEQVCPKLTDYYSLRMSQIQSPPDAMNEGSRRSYWARHLNTIQVSYERMFDHWCTEIQNNVNDPLYDQIFFWGGEALRTQAINEVPFNGGPNDIVQKMRDSLVTYIDAHEISDYEGPDNATLEAIANSLVVVEAAISDFKLREQSNVEDYGLSDQVTRFLTAPKLNRNLVDYHQGVATKLRVLQLERQERNGT